MKKRELRAQVTALRELASRQQRRIIALHMRVGLAEGWLTDLDRDSLMRIREFYPTYRQGLDANEVRTATDVVRVYWPNASQEEMEHLLWEQTCFPVGALSQWWKQLDDLWMSEMRL